MPFPRFSSRTVGLLFLGMIVATVYLYGYPEQQTAQVISNVAFGDLNTDGVVNLQDMTILVSHWHEVNVAQNQGDINQDGIVNFLDSEVITAHWNQTVSGGSSSSIPSGPAPYTNAWEPDPVRIPGSSSDPLSLENGTNVLFMDSQNPNCNNTYSRAQVLNPDTPWCAWTVNINQMLAGDTVYIRGMENIDIGQPNVRRLFSLWAVSGTESQRITFAAYPGELPVFRMGSYVWENYLLMEGDYTVIDGLAFIGNVDTPQGRLYQPQLLQVNSHGIVRNSIFLHNQGYDDIGYGLRTYRDGMPMEAHKAGWGQLVMFWYAKPGSLFEWNIVSSDNPELAPNLQDNATQAHGVDCFQSCDGLVIRNNRLYGGFGHQAIRAAGMGVIIEENDLSNEYHTVIGFSSNNGIIRNNSIHDWTTKDGHFANGVQVGAGLGIQIYNNVFANAGSFGHGIDIGIPQDEPQTMGSGNKVLNNTFYKTGVTGIYLGYSRGRPVSLVENVQNNEFHHNIIYGVGAPGPYEYINAPIALNLFDPQVDSQENNIYANLVHHTDGNPLTVVSRKPVPLPDHSFYTIDQFNTWPVASNNIDADPLFVDPENGDFRLQPGSPAILAGGPCPDVTDDFAGNTRSTTSCTIGAFAAAAPPPTGSSTPISSAAVSSSIAVFSSTSTPLSSTPLSSSTPVSSAASLVSSSAVSSIIPGSSVPISSISSPSSSTIVSSAASSSSFQSLLAQTSTSASSSFSYQYYDDILAQQFISTRRRSSSAQPFLQSASPSGVPQQSSSSESSSVSTGNSASSILSTTSPSELSSSAEATVAAAPDPSAPPQSTPEDEVAVSSTVVAGAIQTAVCGNGIFEFGEECDDANALSGDGCSPICILEQQSLHLAANAACGNAVHELGEQCDDGNTLPGDGCSPVCTAEVRIVQAATMLPPSLQQRPQPQDFVASPQSPSQRIPLPQQNVRSQQFALAQLSPLATSRPPVTATGPAAVAVLAAGAAAGIGWVRRRRTK